MGHEIVIISSKPWWSIHDTLMWLGEKKIPTKEIHFIEDKWKIDCDVYIDDAPYQLDNYVKNIKNKINTAHASRQRLLVNTKKIKNIENIINIKNKINTHR